MSTGIPFRYDIVGSFLRPDYLKKASADMLNGNITQEAYIALQQRAVTELVAKQKELGLKAVTDGEFTRWAWHHDFIAALDGVEEFEIGDRTVFQDVKVTKLKAYRIDGQVAFPQNHPFLSYFHFLNQLCGDELFAKQTIPGPNMVHMGGATNPQSYKNSRLYTDFDQTVKDISTCYQQAIDAFYQAGCRYLQFDDTAWAGLLEPDAKEQYAQAGVDVEEIIERFTYLTAESIKHKPDDMALSFHVCRGNFKSSFLYHGAYNNIAEKLFSLDKFDGFFLEYDDERSGDFSILRHVGKQKVVLGLITTKTPQLEDEDAVIARIHEAAKYMPLEQLCLSPQCGFASTVHGNNVTEQDQWNKLALTKRIAQRVWQDA